MRAIRGKGNATTEIRMIAILRRERLSGWRRHVSLPGRPDFAWPRERVALFVDGCFWHGCPHCYRAPRKNVAFWQQKLLGNQRRDRRVSAQLRRLGWTVIRVKECRVESPGTATRLSRALQEGNCL
jgi:DNA mismatch endonuclease, patch repair protein